MESPESLPIVYDPATGNFSCYLPVTVCNNLLLFCETDKGILLCNKQKEKLDDLVMKIITLHADTQILHTQLKHARRRKSAPAAIVLSVLILSVFFTEPFFKSNPSLRLPLSICGAIIALYCSYILFKNHQLAGLSDNRKNALSHKLALIELQKQINEQFIC